MQYQLEFIKSTGPANKEDANQSYIYKFVLSGNFVMEIAEEFNLLMTTLVSGGMRLCVFEFANLKYVDSTGIGIFINVAKAIRAKGGDLVFLNVQPKILEVFNLVKLNEFIEFYKGDKQVIEHLFSLNHK